MNIVISIINIIIVLNLISANFLIASFLILHIIEAVKGKFTLDDLMSDFAVLGIFFIFGLASNFILALIIHKLHYNYLEVAPIIVAIFSVILVTVTSKEKGVKL